MSNRARQIYKPDFRFGLGGVSLGNEFNKHTDKDAEATLEAAWAVGIRYFDVAPWYGFGLSERRFGHFLHNQKREDYLLSSKVGKLFKASKNNKHAEIYPLSDSPNDVVFEQIQEDYNSLKAKIPSDFWAELKHQGLIEPSASLPASPEL
jgi:D-threo-aldose 1-dehydrogenase